MIKTSWLIPFKKEIAINETEETGRLKPNDPEVIHNDAGSIFELPDLIEEIRQETYSDTRQIVMSQTTKAGLEIARDHCRQSFLSRVNEKLSAYCGISRKRLGELIPEERSRKDRFQKKHDIFQDKLEACLHVEKVHVVFKLLLLLLYISISASVCYATFLRIQDVNFVNVDIAKFAQIGLGALSCTFGALFHHLVYLNLRDKKLLGFIKATEFISIIIFMSALSMFLLWSLGMIIEGYYVSNIDLLTDRLIRLTSSNTSGSPFELKMLNEEIFILKESQIRAATLSTIGMFGLEVLLMAALYTVIRESFKRNPVRIDLESKLGELENAIHESLKRLKSYYSLEAQWDALAHRALSAADETFFSINPPKKRIGLPANNLISVNGGNNGSNGKNASDYFRPLLAACISLGSIIGLRSTTASQEPRSGNGRTKALPDPQGSKNEGR